jgi:hypothetical protein
LTIVNAKICLDCGCLNYRQPLVTSCYGEDNYIADPLGYSIDEKTDEVSENWETFGATVCIDCGSSHLLSIEDFTKDQFIYVFNLDKDKRAEALDKICEGRFILSESKNSKYIGGGKIIQC